MVSISQGRSTSSSNACRNSVTTRVSADSETNSVPQTPLRSSSLETTCPARSAKKTSRSMTLARRCTTRPPFETRPRRGSTCQSPMRNACAIGGRSLNAPMSVEGSHYFTRPHQSLDDRNRLSGKMRRFAAGMKPFRQDYSGARADCWQRATDTRSWRDRRHARHASRRDLDRPRAAGRIAER